MKVYKVLAAVASLSSTITAQQAISANGTYFSLKGGSMSYLFHVDQDSGDLISDHFGGLVDDFTPQPYIRNGGWAGEGPAVTKREFPDIGRGDFRLPAIHISHADGDTVSAFSYVSHRVVAGKPGLSGLPATYGNYSDVTTLIVQMYDNVSDVSAALSYSVFPRYNAVARSFQITNNGSQIITIERAASFSVDLPNLDLAMVELQGDWAHENHRVKRDIDFGETSFRSTAGYSSHFHNPFLSLVSPSTTESSGEAWGLSLIYTGSFSATTERFSHGLIRVLLGLNDLHSSIPVQPGSTFTSPEAVAVYSDQGLNGMSQSFHDLYRNHLSRASYTKKARPVLLNSWEGLGANINQTSLTNLANETAALGIKLFVTDDGWFGSGADARTNDTAGLGDWTPNPARFPDGLGPFVDQVDELTVTNSTQNLTFGIWVEPEMVNPNSSLYREHPEWALHAGNHRRTLTRNQLVLNLALPEVQEYIISFMTKLLDSARITYIKWDNNRGMHELPSPATDHAYILGLYRVIDNLTTAYPDVLWEGCASGGGRFDAGLLYYWPQTWTSDNTDASDRLTIQLGTSLVYPLSSMACHVSAIPNGITQRNISITYRAHVAMMCGSFGLELNPSELSLDERTSLPGLLAQAERLQPLVVNGTFYRLAIPEESNWPAVQFIAQNQSTVAVLAYQQKDSLRPSAPPLRLHGLDAKAKYRNDADNGTYSGATYMNGGLNLRWQGDYQSQLILLQKQG